MDNNCSFGTILPCKKYTYHNVFIPEAIRFSGVSFLSLDSFQVVESFFIKFTPFLDRNFVKMLLPRVNTIFYINLKINAMEKHEIQRFALQRHENHLSPKNFHVISLSLSY